MMHLLGVNDIGDAEMKKVKYFIDFENFENSMCSHLEISKAEYERQLDHLRLQIIKTCESEDETPITARPVRKFEHETTIETITSFNCGCAFVDLTKIECKEGYCFARKNKKKV